MDLLSAFAAASNQYAQTVCVVPDASAECFRHADSVRIKLVSLDRANESASHSEFEEMVWGRLHDANVTFDPATTVWLGHDKITGGIAIEAMKKH